MLSVSANLFAVLETPCSIEITFRDLRNLIRWKPEQHKDDSGVVSANLIINNEQGTDSHVAHEILIDQLVLDTLRLSELLIGLSWLAK